MPAKGLSTGDADRSYISLAGTVLYKASSQLVTPVPPYTIFHAWHERGLPHGRSD